VLTREGDLGTPCAVVDLDVVERNTGRMAARMMDLGVRLRPHVKTHKCLEAARLQVRGHFGGITVSTLAEARFFGDGGFRDLTYAVPIALGRIAEAAELAARLDRLSVLVDSDEAVDALQAEAQRIGRPFSVFLKVDCGNHRAGVDPDADASVGLARRLAESAGIDFRGVLAHGGQSYAETNRAAIHAVACAERDVTAGFAERLRAAGVDVPEVSIGSTPTMAVVDDLTGVTETRPGNYVFFDEYQAAIGSCAPEDCALSVLVSVVGVHPARGTVVVDGGALALSKDGGPTHVPGFPGGYGSLRDAESGAPLPDLELFSLSQEHGLVRSRTGAALGMRVGDRLRVSPNHSCLTAALFDRYHVVRGDRVVDRWPTVRGW
jgi:D-serine deaminase-like pyridoxal phosphate-dependent protein